MAKKKYDETDEANKKLQAEKMKALEESGGDLGELVRRTPGASAKIIHKDGSEELLTEYKSGNRHKEYR